MIYQEMIFFCLHSETTSSKKRMLFSLYTPNKLKQEHFHVYHSSYQSWNGHDSQCFFFCNQKGYYSQTKLLWCEAGFHKVNLPYRRRMWVLSVKMSFWVIMASHGNNAFWNCIQNSEPYRFILHFLNRQRTKNLLGHKYLMCIFLFSFY